MSRHRKRDWGDRPPVVTVSDRLGWLPAADFIWVGLGLVVSSPVWLFAQEAEMFKPLFFAGLTLLFSGLSFFYAKRAVNFVRQDETDSYALVDRPGVLPFAVWIVAAAAMCHLFIQYLTRPGLIREHAWPTFF